METLICFGIEAEFCPESTKVSDDEVYHLMLSGATGFHVEALSQPFPNNVILKSWLYRVKILANLLEETCCDGVIFT